MRIAAAATMTMGVLWMKTGWARRMKGCLTALLRMPTWTVVGSAIATAAGPTLPLMWAAMVAGGVAPRPPSGTELAVVDVTAQ